VCEMQFSYRIATIVLSTMMLTGTLLVLGMPLRAETNKREPGAAAVTSCYFRDPYLQGIQAYKSIQVSNGVVTCIYDPGQFTSQESPLDAASATGVFIDLYENYPNASKYVCLIPRGEFASESFRLVIFKSAIHAAYIGKGESGDTHYDENSIMSHISEYVDGLPVSGYHSP